MKKFTVFAIETSCDETSTCVAENGNKILSLVTSSQIKIHSNFNGVVPELASRAHIQNINSVAQKTLNSAKIDFLSFKKKIDAIAFTNGPGLAGALLVGNMFAKSLSAIYQTHLIPINHLEGHMFSAGIENKNVSFPFLSLIISGGHTELIIVNDFGDYRALGATRDDAVGEAFDKAAKMLGFPYPGGPVIDKMSENGSADNVKFTRPYLKNTWDFSFSGIKTALLNYLKNNPVKNEKHLRDICAGFSQAIADTLIFKTFLAAKTFNLKKIVLGGGVSCNSLVRKMFLRQGKEENIKVFIPSTVYCSDNAAMIAYAAYLKYKKFGLTYSKEELKSEASLSIKSNC
ncbi:MAG: tRNA (adenosine(37)-N6)-threonylcarbamoyltransferase complex transferase subunit TsaD [Elusimicrobiota bacterium]|jgi:N6-L-threonylcarbamoyladenine synthase|nr:tRNA (adenosine(37)-N6)-threonylcarbamoyltransferase complex transferase subunit TsaD [Elusimicrobiota bacterium]